MPTDLAKKWTGGDCGLRQSTGNADRTIDLARLRECDLRKDDLTSLGYRASLAGFVTHTANLEFSQIAAIASGSPSARLIACSLPFASF